MSKLYLLLGLVSLLLCAGCGSSSSSSGVVTGFIPKGNYSAASLNGQYVYQIEGFDLSNNGAPYREAGVFSANGSGVITSVTDDLSEGGSVFSNTGTGVYGVNNDGSGTLSFNVAGGTINLALTLVSASKVYLIEIDSVLSAGGLAEKQDPTAIAAVPNGTFVFREHDLNLSALQSVGSVGTFTMSGGTVSAGSKDVNTSGALTSVTFTAGSFNLLNPTIGRGTGTLTDSSPATSSFFYYIVDANNIRFLSETPGITGLGRAELQTGTPALSGSYAFGSKGDTATLDGVNAAGSFTASGGNITAGALDTVQDGTSGSDVVFTGTYTQPTSGRFLVSLNTTLNNSLIVWMESPSRGFFLVNDASNVSEGTLDLQQTSNFSNATMNGQYAFVMGGIDTGGTSTKDRVGTLLWDGAGNLTLNEIANASGALSGPVVLSGDYSVSSNGRTTGSINTVSSNLVFYLVSATDAYVVQNDSGAEVSGTISKQQ